jgi:membrane protein implicated in regulation of membrane protease activity
MEWFEKIVFWHWWLLSGALLLFELNWPVFVYLWLSFAAAAVGFLLLIIPDLALTLQLLLFGALSMVAVLAWRHYRRTHPSDAE